MRLNATILAGLVLLVSSCFKENGPPVIPRSDVEAVLRIAMPAINAHFSTDPTLCLSPQLAHGFLDQPDTDYDWISIDATARMRRVPTEYVETIPTELLKGWRLAGEHRNCDQTLRLFAPDFFEQQHRGKTQLEAMVTIFRCSGETCRDTWNATFQKVSGRWGA